jgi:hypothetical protein
MDCPEPEFTDKVLGRDDWVHDAAPINLGMYTYEET